MSEEPERALDDTNPKKPVSLEDYLRAEEPPISADDTSPRHAQSVEDRLRAEEPPVSVDDTSPSLIERHLLSDDWPPREPRSGGRATRVLGIVLLFGAVMVTALAAYIWMDAEDANAPERIADLPQNTPTDIAAASPTQTAAPTPLQSPVQASAPAGPEAMPRVFPTAAADEIAVALLTPVSGAPRADAIPRESEPFTIRSAVERTRVIQYTVQAGDTLESIAAKFGLDDFYSIVWSNSRSKYNSLRAGIQLNIPPGDGAYHEVTENITIAALGEQYGVDPYDIIDSEYNNLFGSIPETVLVKGMWVVVPGGEGERVNLLSAGGQSVSGSTSSGSISGTYILWGCSSTITGGSPPYTRPLQDYTWMQGFSLGGHEGVDLAADVGSPVSAAGAGSVAYAGWIDTGYGYVVVIAHGPTFSLYGHLASTSVSCGQSVSAGQGIGRSGNSGNSTGPHLHFELRDANWNPINPQNYIGF
jgi:murein DD-endopeptidase MepM/ murein hydrolase activator NlpD